MSEVTVDALEEQLKREKSVVELRDSAIKLSGNREFKRLILDGFCGTEAARYVQESADPLLSDRQRADALAMAQASGHLKRFLSIMVQQGNTSARNVKELEEALDEARALEGEE
jgi:hypothetical protein